jgi:hypothetical protein
MFKILINLISKLNLKKVFRKKLKIIKEKEYKSTG